MSQPNSTVQFDMNTQTEHPMRSPSEMMGERRVLSAINNPLSFARTGMRELLKGNWRLIKDRFDLDADGRGEVLYRLTDGEWEFHFYLLSNKLPEEKKLDRNFAGTWEAMGVLCEGPWTPEREAHLRIEIPKQVDGRSDYDTLVYVRGNRSGRLFQYVVDCLAEGVQPDARQIASVGYILRTTAFIGNGQLGTRPLAGYDPDHPMRRPYHAQIWSAFILREYVFDLVEHMARAINPEAVRLSEDIRRYLGLGNSAATGLVPFIANHPLLIHRWVEAQESAMAKARSKTVNRSASEVERFKTLLSKAVQYFKEHDAAADGFFVPSQQISQELADVIPVTAEFQSQGTIAGGATTQPWLTLHKHLTDTASGNTVEIYNAILLDVYPDIVDEYTDAFMGEERQPVDPTISVGQLEANISEHYDWAINDVDSPDSEYYFWYRAEAAPFDLRRGVKGVVPELESETPMDTVRLIRELLSEIRKHNPDAPILDILLARPDLRHIIGRVQNIVDAAYGELRINLLKKAFSPFGPVRFVLSFYGMEKFEGANPKVVRGAFLQGAPIAEDLERRVDGSWPFPLIPQPGNSTNRVIPPSKVGSGVTGGSANRRNSETAMVTDSDWVVSAPVELKRLIQTTLHGAGLALGEAMEVAEVVLFYEAMNAPKAGFLPDMLTRNFSNKDAQHHVNTKGSDLIVDAQSASALQIACSALDWVCCHALTNEQGFSAAFVNNTKDAAVLDQLALRCADRGLLGVFLWRTGEKSGFTFSGPGSVGPWLARWESGKKVPMGNQALCEQVNTLLARISADQQPLNERGALKSVSKWSNAQLITALENFVSSFTSGAHGVPTTQSQEYAPEDFALVCLKIDADLSNQLFDHFAHMTDRGRGMEYDLISAYSSEDMCRIGQQWNRKGIVVKRDNFQALSKAARKLLVPDSQEHRLRPDEVIDPLKIF